MAKKKKKSGSGRTLPVMGIILVLLGTLGVFDRYFPGLELWPLILIGLGVAMIIEEKR